VPQQTPGGATVPSMPNVNLAPPTPTPLGPDPNLITNATPRPAPAPYIPRIVPPPRALPLPPIAPPSGSTPSRDTARDTGGNTTSGPARRSRPTRVAPTTPSGSGHTPTHDGANAGVPERSESNPSNSGSATAEGGAATNAASRSNVTIDGAAPEPTPAATATPTAAAPAGTPAPQATTSIRASETRIQQSTGTVHTTTTAGLSPSPGWSLGALLGALLGAGALWLAPARPQITISSNRSNQLLGALAATALLSMLSGLVSSLAGGATLPGVAEWILLTVGLGGAAAVSIRCDNSGGLAASALWLAAASFLWSSRAMDSGLRILVIALTVLAMLAALAVCFIVFVRERPVPAATAPTLAGDTDDPLLASISAMTSVPPARPLSAAIIGGGQLQSVPPAQVTPGQLSARQSLTGAAAPASLVAGAPTANAPAIARLVAVEGPLTGNTFTLLSGQNSLGRDAQVMTGNQILLAGDDAVSRVHATILCDKGRCTVYDQGSVNGLFLNGARVLDERDLMSDDLLRMGDTILRYEKL
jgi:hypothetical protein